MKIFIPVILIIAMIAFLVFSAVEESSKQVMTVKILKTEGVSRKRIRLGARVSNHKIEIKDSPEDASKKHVEFLVVDPEGDPELHLPQSELKNNDQVMDEIRVIYKGMMPDTLKEGRDVILEGDFVVNESGQAGVFNATTLNTQCPSKYKPPQPGDKTDTYR